MISDTKTILDADALRQYTGGDETITRHIYRKFLAQSKNDVGLLRAAFGRNAQPEIVGAAHRIKGSSQMIGAVRQGELSAQIERAARSGDVAKARATMEEFEREHTRLLRHIAALVGD
jgi:HPt (histidine-containing phosphotransfer) domain-containing protein